LETQEGRKKSGNRSQKTRYLPEKEILLCLICKSVTDFPRNIDELIMEKRKERGLPLVWEEE
jgi:hypothetical protein